MKKNIYYTNFLPLVINNFLKKGEKEKSFVKVSKILLQLKKTLILSDSFFANKHLFYFKSIQLFKKKELKLNNFNFDNNIRYEMDFFFYNRIYYFLTNFYTKDFFKYIRYNEDLKKRLKKKKKN